MSKKVLQFPSPQREPDPPAVAARNQRVAEYLDIVEPIATGIHSMRPPSFELDDLIQIGRVALIEAADSFDPSLNVPFEAYAKFKVRNAINDATRRKQYREHTHDGICDWHAEMKDERLPIDEVIAERQERTKIRAAIVMLSESQRTVIVGKYYQGRTLGEIGQNEGVTYSHGITQLHREALRATKQAISSVGLRRAA
jgi:RNA polymerase sigma factor (sigma-70 family)